MFPWRALLPFGRSGPVPAAVETALDRHVLDAWFPRCLDEHYGGYLCDFDRAWCESGRHEKLLEFQARQTRVAALACRRRPGDSAAAAWCRHGFAALTGPQVDREHGGLYALCARDGTQLANGDKHGHGIAYAIHALIDVAAALDEPRALEAARELFDWYDAHAWDREHGGYWGWMRADGVPYARLPAQAPGAVDQVGTPVGAKDTNVNGDSLEALAALAAATGEPRAQQRVAFLVDLFERLTRRHGRLPARLDRTLDAIGDEANAGNALQASWRLPAARALLGIEPSYGAIERTLRAAAERERGPSGGLRVPAGEEQWWVQFERLRAAAVAADLDTAHRDDAAETLRRSWRQVRREHFDERHGGVAKLPASSSPARIKGSRWKDGSHEAFAFDEILRRAPA
jgi:mannobiose 2-epimerase